MSEAARPIWLCADDYGISRSVSEAIRELFMRRRINATSVMVVAPSFHRSEAAPLAVLNAAPGRSAVGLHVTLSGPFKPLTTGFKPLRDGKFLPFQELLRRSMLRRLSRLVIEAEIAAQLEAFKAAFGRAPDFVDGHQHVHHFPQVRDAFLHAVKAAAPNAWVRQCGRVPVPLARRFTDYKGTVLDLLSRTFRRRAAALGIAVNPAFAGTYDFAAADTPAFPALFPHFLDGLPAGGLVMCHPGRVDAELRQLDPLTDQREREYDYFAGEEFSALLNARGVTLD